MNSQRREDVNTRLDRRLFGFLLLVVMLGLFVGMLENENVGASVTANKVFVSLEYDGHTKKYDVNYFVARNATTAEVHNTTLSTFVGQTVVSSIYYLYRLHLYFDTSIIPNSATITSVKLALYINLDNSITDFNVTIQNGQPIHPHIPLQGNDYYMGWYSGNGGSRNTNTITGNGYWNVSFSSSNYNWINKAGISKFCLRSSRDINGNTPSGAEYLSIYSRNQGEVYAPKLYVAYEYAFETPLETLLHMFWEIVFGLGSALLIYLCIKRLKIN